MISVLLANVALSCACSASWPYYWAPTLYRAAAVAERAERRLFDAPAVVLGWTLGGIGIVVLALGCVLISLATWLLPMRDREGQPFSIEDLEA